MTTEIPEIAEPAVVDVKALAEETNSFGDLDQFEQVDIRLRETAGWIAMAFVVTFWIAGVCVAIFLFLSVSNKGIPSDGRWAALTAMIIALISAPTIIILAVLNSTKRKKIDSPEPDPLPVVQIVEAVFKGVKS